MVLPQNTVKLLGELENTSNRYHLRGFEAEILVIKHYLERGFTLLAHRKKFFGTEVDVIVESHEKIILIEVKYSTHREYDSWRLTLRQRRRLENVFLRFVNSTPKEVEFHYVIASQSGQIEVFDEFLSG